MVYVYWGVAAVLAIFLLLRMKRLVFSMLFSAITGLGALWLVGYTSAYTGIVLVPNAFNVIVSALGGIPGVTALLFLRLVWQT